MHTDIDKPRDQVVGARLRELPSELSPPYGWNEFRSRLSGGREPGRENTYGRQAIAAAVVLVAVALIAVWGRVGKPTSRAIDPASMRVTDPASAQDSAEADAGRASSTGGPNSDPASHSPRARALERWLASLPREPGVIRVGTRADVAGLEDQIAQMDDLLSSARLQGIGQERLVALQRERARMLGSLAQVRFAEVVADESP
jgi:hypothetical protein